MTPAKRTVRVQILGEEYNLRSATSPEETEAIVRYVDTTIREIVQAAGVFDTHRAAVLACLRIAGELFEARTAATALAQDMEALSRDVRPWLPPSKRHD